VGVRSYSQYCPVAVALDAIGDRWTLLILRELVLGDQRFTDLRSALTGIAPNLLSARLAELVEMGLVAKAELPPPAARSVYRLTERGQDVRPVLGALARFGVADMPPAPDDPPMRPVGALLSLLASWYVPAEGATAPSPVRVVVDGEAFDLALGARAERVVPGPGTPAPELVVEATAADLLAARQGRAPLRARFDGPAGAEDAFLRAFRFAPVRAASGG
jgi:DNA-binding HxlR family transcriptional regulator